jgi:hypothetical protein
VNGLSSLLATIQKLYPQARVTSGYRGPGNPLTQAHPGSFHARGNPEDPGAVDVAPIPGMSFDQYVSSIKGAGVPVAQAFDEQKHPFPWTTGPNWHIGQGQAPVATNAYYPAKKPRTLGDVMPKPDLSAQVPVDIGGGQQTTLGTLLQPQLAALPQGKVPDHKGLFHGKDWAAIAGIIGDAMTAYGGGQPQFAPALNQRHRDEQQQSFDREKWAAQLEAERAKASEPPQFVQNLQAWLALPEPLKQQYIQYQDITNPIAISGPQGTQRVPRQMGGGTQTIDGVTYYNVNGQWYDNPEGR